MKISEPSSGTALALGVPTRFRGVAGTDVKRIELRMGSVLLGAAAVDQGGWEVVRSFSSNGVRTISAHALDSKGKEVGTDEVRIFLMARVPPAPIRARLGGILELIAAGRPLNAHFEGLEAIYRLPSGELYFESDLDLDTDGLRESGIRYDADHQDQTSLDPKGQAIDANETPYFVLPGGFPALQGIKLGDVGAVLYRDRIAFALFADIGPRRKIGEGSLALHRALGIERVRNGRIQNCGIDSGVATLVFPGSGNGHLQPAAEIERIGRAAFRKLGGQT